MSHLKQNQNTNINIQIQCKKDVESELIKYTEEEYSIWASLYKEQVTNLENKAITKFFDCLKLYNLPKDRIPQIVEISSRLKKQTGWEIVRVEELIDSRSFFEFLANKKFPSTVYIRKKEELHISKDPDIFHEVFGHSTMLLDSKHAYYMQLYGQIALKLNEIERNLLQRLFWFTYEVGLIQTKAGIRIYGGSILSSSKESIYAMEDKIPERRTFVLTDVFRTPYRADKLQDTYYILNNFQELFDILDNKDYLQKKIWEAYYLGEFPAKFISDKSRYENINCCERILSVKC